jgi:hypothetical protein
LILAPVSFYPSSLFLFLCQQFLRDKFIEVSIDVFPDDVAVCFITTVYLFPRRVDARSVS